MTTRFPALPTATELALWRQREEELDCSGMRAHVAGFGRRLGIAVPAAREFASCLRADPAPVAIAVLGMGGSAVAGDLVAAATAARRRLPLCAVRAWDPPAWLGDRAFVIASSYSGDTEETVAAYRTARERGARGAAITTGGRLAALARKLGDPVLDLPPGLPPRAALPESLAGCALAVGALDPGLEIDGLAGELSEAAAALEPRLDGWLDWEERNPALALAVSFADRLPIVYGGHPVSIAAAHRWKTQLNENGKIPAWGGAFPEHGHNEIVGFEGSHPALDRLALVYLETPWDDSRVSGRMAWTREWCDGRVGVQHRVESGGDTPLEGMLRLCCMGDCTSFLVSIITGKDPTPVASIDQLKAGLAR
ncbi:MAG TPA: SIS domain-containing protein [Gemmatimonadota bacterium]|nr:SIS domain-containing protein [Gemmatimonadota bacterium]